AVAARASHLVRPRRRRRIPDALPDRLEPGHDPMASRPPAALPSLALAALSTAAALTLGRVFQSGRFVLPVVAAVLPAHFLWVVARTRSRSLVDPLSPPLPGVALSLA